MNPALFNSVLRVERQTQIGDEDGTPITEMGIIEIPGWFDEPLAGMKAAISSRDGMIPTALRRAVFLCDAHADIKTRDEGTILVGGPTGINAGRWTVAKDELVPVPGGYSHREWGLEQSEETR